MSIWNAQCLPGYVKHEISIIIFTCRYLTICHLLIEQTYKQLVYKSNSTSHLVLILCLSYIFYCKQCKQFIYKQNIARRPFPTEWFAPLYTSVHALIPIVFYAGVGKCFCRNVLFACTLQECVTSATFWVTICQQWRT